MIENLQDRICRYCAHYVRVWTGSEQCWHPEVAVAVAHMPIGAATERSGPCGHERRLFEALEPD